MKKSKKSLKYAVASLLILSLASSLFMGCGSKTNAASSNKTVAGNNAGNGRMNTDAMKKRMEDSISSLVTAGTITKDQEAKILDALTTGKGGFGRNRNGNQNSQGQQNTNGNSPNSGNNGNSSNSNNGQGQRHFGNGQNPLSKLVTDGIITQAQADAVMAKIRGNMGRNNNGNSSNNNNNSNNNGNNNSSI